MNKQPFVLLKWISSRIVVIYLILFLFMFTCVDMQKLDLRIKIRQVNATMPNFSPLVAFAKHKPGASVNWKQYKEYFELILKNNFDDVMTKNLLGYAYYYMGKKDKAQRMFEDSFYSGYQNSFWASYNLGVLHYKEGRYLLASQYFKKTININYMGSLEVMRKSIIYHQIFAASEFTYNIDEEIIDAVASCYLLLASSLINLGQFEPAISICAMALKNPQITKKDGFFFYTGVAFFKLGFPDKSIMFFEKNLELDKNNPWTYFYLSQIYMSVGRQEDGVKLLEMFQVLNKSDKKVLPYDLRMEPRFF